MKVENWPGKTGLDKIHASSPWLSPVPPLYRQNSEPPGNMTRVLLIFFCQMIKLSGHEVFLTTTVNSVDLNLVRTSACYRYTCTPVFCSEMSTCTIHVIFSEFLKDKIVE